jgi:hypothetical protein
VRVIRIGCIAHYTPYRYRIELATEKNFGTDEILKHALFQAIEYNTTE